MRWALRATLVETHERLLQGDGTGALLVFDPTNKRTLVLFGQSAVDAATSDIEQVAGVGPLSSCVYVYRMGVAARPEERSCRHLLSEARFVMETRARLRVLEELTARHEVVLGEHEERLGDHQTRISKNEADVAALSRKLADTDRKIERVAVSTIEIFRISMANSNLLVVHDELIEKSGLAVNALNARIDAVDRQHAGFRATINNQYGTIQAQLLGLQTALSGL